MRNNLPVTNVEYQLADDCLIVSKTDAKGRITYFNKAFLDASGFSAEELMGQPHNIVRHPDMPPEAFDNLWTTLKAGRPWYGAVKNRRKNGDYYWVLASASPIWENGAVTGYMSIRSKLAGRSAQEAEQVYAQIRAKQCKDYTVADGIIRQLTDVRPAVVLHRHDEGAADHAGGGAGDVHDGDRRDRHGGDTTPAMRRSSRSTRTAPCRWRSCSTSTTG